MVHIFSSTPPYCTLVTNQANPSCTGHSSNEWIGAWKTLTCGPLHNADCLHCHAGAAGAGLWSDTTGEIQPCVAGCDIVPNGTACVGQSGDKWQEGHFGIVNAGTCITAPVGKFTSQFHFSGGTPAANCFLKSIDATGQAVWATVPGGSSKWTNEATGTWIYPSSSCCACSTEIRTSCLDVSGKISVNVSGTSCAFYVAAGQSMFTNNSLSATLKICNSSKTRAALCVYGISHFDGALFPVDNVACNIGASSHRWNCGYFKYLNVTGGGSIISNHICPVSTNSYCLGGSSYLWEKIYGCSVVSQCTTASTCMILNGWAITATGAKSLATIEYEKDRFAQLKVEESPETVFNDHGNVKVLSKIPCYIKFDCIFQKVTEDGIDYNLQITPNNESVNLVQDVWKVSKREDGFIINSSIATNFDWYVRKIRRFRKNDRWLKDGKEFNPKDFTEDEMNTMESYPKYMEQIQENIVQDVWGKQK